MSLIPWRARQMWLDPFQEVERIQREMNRLFDTSVWQQTDRDVGLLEGIWSPALDIYESKDSLMVRADIPGMNKDDLEVTVRDNMLVIRGEKKGEKQTHEKDLVRAERFYGSFHRVIALPTKVDEGKISAGYKNGVLELTLPKREDAKPKQIKVDVA